MKNEPIADTLAARAGTTLEQVARLWPMGQKLTTPQLKRRMARIRHVVKHGMDTQENFESAQILAIHLRCDVGILLHGYAAHRRRITQHIAAQVAAQGAFKNGRRNGLLPVFAPVAGGRIGACDGAGNFNDPRRRTSPK